MEHLLTLVKVNLVFLKFLVFLSGMYEEKLYL